MAMYWLCVFALLLLCTSSQPISPLEAFSCDEALEQSALFTGILVTDALWERTGNALQPLVDCLPVDSDAILIFNTTRMTPLFCIPAMQQRRFSH